MLTAQQIAEINEAVCRIASSPGFGEVAIIVEQGRPVRLRETADKWLGRRRDPPPKGTTQQP